MGLPLEGLRILAVEQYGAGPFGTQFLSDQGAEVIKIESPAMGGDYARNVGPYFFNKEHSQFFHSFNRNKKSLSLDISRSELICFLDVLRSGLICFLDKLCML